MNSPILEISLVSTPPLSSPQHILSLIFFYQFSVVEQIVQYWWFFLIWCVLYALILFYFSMKITFPDNSLCRILWLWVMKKQLIFLWKSWFIGSISSIITTLYYITLDPFRANPLTFSAPKGVQNKFSQKSK